VAIVEKVIPDFHQLLVIFRGNLLDLPQFFSREPSTSFEANWIEPHLCIAIITFHMYVWRFIPVTGIEEESIRTNSQNSGHQSLAILSRMEQTEIDAKSAFRQNVTDQRAARRDSQLPNRSISPFRCIGLFVA